MAQFTSDITKIFLDLYDVYVKFITPYHPESNDLVGNRNKKIGKLLRLQGRQHKEWDEILPSALWALRTTKNLIINHSSFKFVHGREDQQSFNMAARPTKGSSVLDNIFYFYIKNIFIFYIIVEHFDS